MADSVDLPIDQVLGGRDEELSAETGAGHHRDPRTEVGRLQQRTLSRAIAHQDFDDKTQG